KFPLGTNHKFNGFADKFLSTPGAGLQDAYIAGGFGLPFEMKGKVIYHKFFAADGGDDFGDEIDVVLTKDLGNGLSLLAKYAYYWSDEDAFTDIHRFSIQLDYKF
ncbi:MAG: hypothetical protein AAF585_25270, partial [Verrucomicrobiota bacterium]